MAYDEELANRIRRALAGRRDVTERKMFGGLAFLCQGRMCCGIVGNDLMVRVPLDEFDAALRRRHVRPMDFTGKPLRGFVYVSPPGFRTATACGHGCPTASAWQTRKPRDRGTEPQKAVDGTQASRSAVPVAHAGHDPLPATPITAGEINLKRALTQRPWSRRRRGWTPPNPPAVDRPTVL
jgi:hypothetical protein